jgi:hypothetical protein
MLSFVLPSQDLDFLKTSTFTLDSHECTLEGGKREALDSVSEKGNLGYSLLWKLTCLQPVGPRWDASVPGGLGYTLPFPAQSHMSFLSGASLTCMSLVSFPLVTLILFMLFFSFTLKEKEPAILLRHLVVVLGSNRSSPRCHYGKTMLQGPSKVEQGRVGGSSQSIREVRRELSDLHLYRELADSPLPRSSTLGVQVSSGIIGNWHPKRGQRLSKGGLNKGTA